MAGLVAHLTSIAVDVGSIPAGSVEESKKCISGYIHCRGTGRKERKRNNERGAATKAIPQTPPPPSLICFYASFLYV